MKPARNHFSVDETLKYYSSPFNNLLQLSTGASSLSMATAAAARALPVDLRVLGELAATHAKQGIGPSLRLTVRYYH